MRVGLDVRAALFGTTGFARVAAETFAALARRDDVDLVGYGVAWKRAQPGALLSVQGAPARLVRRRLPARLVAAGRSLGLGVESFLGPLDVFHHLDLVYAPVRRAREVVTVHDVLFLETAAWHGARFRRTVAPRLAAALRRASAVVVPDRRVAEALAAHALVAADRVHVVPLGCDHVDPTPQPDDGARVAGLLSHVGLKRAGGELLVLVPGTREPRKNQLALVRAFLASGRGPAGVMLLVGPRGWGCPELEALLGHPPDPTARRRVATAGAVSERDLGALLRRADVVAYPSLAEGFGLPVAEALAAGRPVLTSRNTPMAGFSGAAAQLVDPTDPADLARGLERLLTDEERRASLSAAAPAAVAGLTWDRTAARLLSVYTEALS